MSIFAYYDDPKYNPRPTPDDLVKEVRERPDTGHESVYPAAYGGLSYHYTALLKQYDRLLKSAREVERRKEALEFAIEYQHGTDEPEIYAAADVHEKALEAGKPVRRELKEDELKHGKVITDDERCSHCDEYMQPPTPYNGRLCCPSCVEMFEEEEADPQFVA